MNIDPIQKADYINIFFDSIYSDSSCRIEFNSNSAFEARCSGNIINISKGELIENGWIKSEPDGSRHKIEITFLEWLFGRAIENSAHKSSATNQYGMRFYPFVSSFLKGSIELREVDITPVVVELPDKYRCGVVSAHFTKAV